MQALSTDPAKLSTELTTSEFIAQCRGMMIPVGDSVAYFSVLPLDEQESERLVFEPLSSLPPKVLEILPMLRLVLVPYLAADPNPKQDQLGSRIAFDEPAGESRRFAAFESSEGENFVFVAVREEGLFDAHIVLYSTLSIEIVNRVGAAIGDPFNKLLDSELDSNARGEVNELPWELKKELLSLASDADTRPEVFDNYRREALEQTLTLYLHGLCCDIDVDNGPKQLASSYIRKRLVLLKEQLPPPKGVALFPEELTASQ